MQTPILRSLFGQTNDQVQQSDIVMLLTPHIVRTHELTVQDLSSIYIGTQQNVGLGGPPPLIAPGGGAGAGAGGAAAPAGAAGVAGGALTRCHAPGRGPDASRAGWGGARRRRPGDYRTGSWRDAPGRGRSGSRARGAGRRSGIAARSAAGPAGSRASQGRGGRPGAASECGGWSGA